MKWTQKLRHTRQKLIEFFIKWINDEWWMMKDKNNDLIEWYIDISVTNDTLKDQTFT